MQKKPQKTFLNWGKANFEAIRQEHATIEWERLLSGKETLGKCETFKSKIGRVQGQHVPVE